MEIAIYIGVGLLVIIVLLALRNRSYLKDLMAAMDEALGDADDVAFPKEIPSDIIDATRQREWPPAPWTVDPKVTLATAGLYPFLRMEAASSQARLMALTQAYEQEKSKEFPDEELVKHLQELRIHESNVGAQFLLTYCYIEETAKQPQGTASHVG